MERFIHGIQQVGIGVADAAFEIALGDLGIFATKIRCKDIAATHNFYKNESENILTEPSANPENKKHFYIKHP